QWAFSPVPWSWYSRCPQYSFCLHPPPMAKVLFAPFTNIKPPPVTKSHSQAFTEVPIRTTAMAAIPSAYPAAITLRIVSSARVRTHHQIRSRLDRRQDREDLADY